MAVAAAAAAAAALLHLHMLLYKLAQLAHLPITIPIPITIRITIPITIPITITTGSLRLVQKLASTGVDGPCLGGDVEYRERAVFHVRSLLGWLEYGG